MFCYIISWNSIENAAVTDCSNNISLVTMNVRACVYICTFKNSSTTLDATGHLIMIHDTYTQAPIHFGPNNKFSNS